MNRSANVMDTKSFMRPALENLSHIVNENVISEKEIDTINSKDIDFTIDNNASIDILYQNSVTHQS